MTSFDETWNEIGLQSFPEMTSFFGKEIEQKSRIMSSKPFAEVERQRMMLIVMEFIVLATFFSPEEIASKDSSIVQSER